MTCSVEMPGVDRPNLDEVLANSEKQWRNATYKYAYKAPSHWGIALICAAVTLLLAWLGATDSDRPLGIRTLYWIVGVCVTAAYGVGVTTGRMMRPMLPDGELTFKVVKREGWRTFVLNDD